MSSQLTESSAPETNSMPACRRRRGASAQAAYVVMVGQREHIDAALRGALQLPPPV